MIAEPDAPGGFQPGGGRRQCAVTGRSTALRWAWAFASDLAVVGSTVPSATFPSTKTRLL